MHLSGYFRGKRYVILLIKMQKGSVLHSVKHELMFQAAEAFVEIYYCM